MDIITQNFPFWRSILSCFPAPLIEFFLAILFVFTIIIFVRMIIGFLG